VHRCTPTTTANSFSNISATFNAHAAANACDAATTRKERHSNYQAEH
jgi:hypothetical protein